MQYNAPVDCSTGTIQVEEKKQSALGYWEYESIQQRCVLLQGDSFAISIFYSSVLFFTPTRLFACYIKGHY